MAKQVISVNGEERVVREDTAKAFRGVHWALISLAAFILIAILMFMSGMLNIVTDDRPPVSPTQDRGPVTR